MFLTSIILILAVLLWKRIFRTCDNEVEITSKKAILITGCDSGIGLQLAQYFYEKGLTVICGYIDIESEGYKQLSQLSSLTTLSRCLHLIKLDVTSDQDIANVLNFVSMNTASKKFELHALINNAGICIYGEFDWLTSKQIDDLFSINVLGAIKLSKAMLKFLIQSKGRLINVSSVNDSTVFPGLSIYSATKSAISIFSKVLSYEMRKFGVNVITIRLGDFAKLTNIMSRHECNKNDMWADMDEEKQSLYKDFFDQFNGHILKNYGMTSPKDFAHSTLFEDFNCAILSKSPPYTITCAPTQFKIFYWFLEQVPRSFQHILLDWMFYFAFGWSSTKCT